MRNKRDLPKKEEIMTKFISLHNRGHFQYYSYPLATFKTKALRLTVPDYQRDYVWEKERYQSYIKTLADGRMPAAPVFIDTRNKDNHTWEIIDGKHRIKAILDFVNNKLEVDGVYYKDMDIAERRSFDMIIIPTYDVRSISKEEVIQLYLDLNFAAVPHTGQDREKAENILEALEVIDKE